MSASLIECMKQARMSVMSCVVATTARQGKSTNWWSEWFKGLSDDISDACWLSVVTRVEIAYLEHPRNKH
jgi:hypothetical protein